MGYNSIMSVLPEADLDKSALSAAIEISRQADAHLDVLAMGLDRTPTAHLYAGANALIQQDARNDAVKSASDIAKASKERLRGEGTRWAVDEGVVHLPLLNRYVASRARFADLVIMPQPYGEGKGAEYEAICESALFDARVPLLVCPQKFAKIDARRIVIGWNESPEALAAIRAALPVLKAAELVSIAVIDPPVHSADRSDPGGPLSKMLARHGVTTQISVLSKSMPRISDVLMRHMSDIDAGLMVMGAYGHSRFREAILGGATRDMLQNIEKPVLFSH
ncbi:universal stress protein [Halocynthiibacter sp.]|uniref:universal stress protein n=1 Tax=Halocynthiibacter sp. TaxID=1979210 RepID=UPI003C6B957C